MSVLVVNGRFLGGMPTGIHRVGRGFLDGLRGEGVALEVVAPAGTIDPRVDRVTWHPPGTIGSHLWEQVLLPLAARGRPLLCLANTAPLAYRSTYVLIHDIAPVMNPGWFTASGRAYGRIMMAAARRARGVVVPSEQVRRELATVGVPAGRIYAVHPAIAEGFGPADPSAVDAVRSRLRLERPYLLHVGWGLRRDVATIASAHLQLAPTVQHDLILVGQRHPNLVQQPIPEAPTIRRVGFVSDEDLRSLLTGAAALLFPTRYEGFGLPPLEALACGTPAIVSDIPVLRESAGGAATYVAPGDVEAWARAMADALAGALTVNRPPPWSWDDAAAKLRRALEALGCL